MTGEKNIRLALDKHLQRSLVLIKPDGVRRGLSGEILKRLEAPGLKIVALKMIKIDRRLAERHYTHEDIGLRHGEAIRNQLLDYITEGPVIAAVFEGIGCVATIRKICGKTEPSSSPPGTIRGDYCHQNYEFCNEVNRSIRNLVHASATTEEAKKEVGLWFNEQEFFDYRRSDDEEHLYG